MNRDYEYDIDINTRHPFPVFLTFPAVEALQREDTIHTPLPGGMETWDGIEEWAEYFDAATADYT